MDYQQIFKLFSKLPSLYRVVAKPLNIERSYYYKVCVEKSMSLETLKTRVAYFQNVDFRFYENMG